MAEERVWEMRMEPGLVGCPHSNNLALLQVDRQTDGPCLALDSLDQLQRAANSRNVASKDAIIEVMHGDIEAARAKL